jgi:hypothetical protein
MTKPNKTARARTMLKKHPNMPVKELAALVGCTVATVYKMRSTAKKDKAAALHSAVVHGYEFLEDDDMLSPPAVISEPTANQVQVGGDHYRSTIQPWDVIRAWDLGFFSGNVVKYMARYPLKGGVEDLQKARHYLDKLIEIETEEGARE